MKVYITFVALLITSISIGQAYTGKEDQKFQVGLNLQDNGTGIQATYDYGVGENISFGIATVYLLGVDDLVDADFDQRADVRARFNANIGNVLNVDPRFDLYPGLSFGTKNFGGHLGARFFFSDGFGIYTEAQVPFAKYDNGDLTQAEELNNQFNFNIGMSFNL
ncbi:hypothetical protein SAMN05192588_1437 [Nonlabens sp. Hel1_33_55]|uniref:DUF6646 family protein n=1 Tax=Nonlabens sp. Hel1_33_55 TaxID=1336802 RepID=UPI000875E171|nr:DUF6646 family protein [Nonlabens sp. Hel1_33_55]SCY16005.1 hypothetical protein SAMN05192588_1437 [Nonlabens sp. Hel1_33_55]